MIESAAEILSHHADADAVDSFIAYRKKHKRAALSERAAMMIAKTLRQINAEGGDATEALDLAQEHGWQTIKADWYWNAKGKSNGNGTKHLAGGKPNAGTEQAAIAARFDRTPSGDCF